MKKKLLLISVCILIVLFLYWYFFVDMNHLPKGTLIASYPSPDNEHIVNVYLCEGNATTAYSWRAEVITRNHTRNIYWQYKEPFSKCEWISNDVIVINGKQLNVLYDTYDWRR